MSPVFYSVSPQDIEDFRFAYFEDNKNVITTVTQWCIELSKKYPYTPLILVHKPCRQATAELKETLCFWLKQKKLPQDIVIPFITKEGITLDLLKKIGDGIVLTNAQGDDVKTPRTDLPADFLLDCLYTNDLPTGCPLDEIKNTLSKLPPII